MRYLFCCAAVIVASVCSEAGAVSVEMVGTIQSGPHAVGVAGPGTFVRQPLWIARYGGTIQTSRTYVNWSDVDELGNIRPPDWVLVGGSGIDWLGNGGSGVGAVIVRPLDATVTIGMPFGAAVVHYRRTGAAYTYASGPAAFAGTALVLRP